MLKFHDISRAGTVSIFLWNQSTTLNGLIFHMHVSDDDSNKFCKFYEIWWLLKKCWNLIIFLGPVSQFILPPGQVAPRGASQPRLPCPPGGKLSRDILPPTLVIFTPVGQAVQAGLSCPPPNTSKNIYMLFCYFSVSF